MSHYYSYPDYDRARPNHSAGKINGAYYAIMRNNIITFFLEVLHQG